ncbi:MAG: YfiR family protein [Candidatus Zixiibacteriota bacterium]
MKYAITAITLAILMISGPMASASNITTEMIKATFLEKIANFIEWPDSTLEKDSSNAFIIGVVGENIFGDLLDELYKDRKIKNEKTKIMYFPTAASIGRCNILFISKSETKHLKEILDIAGEYNALTVGDTNGFGDKGVLVNFYNHGNKVSFEINECALKNSKLIFSHHLYSVAKIIHCEEKHE